VSDREQNITGCLSTLQRLSIDISAQCEKMSSQDIRAGRSVTLWSWLMDSDLTMDQHVIQCCQVLSHRGWTTPIHYCTNLNKLQVAQHQVTCKMRTTGTTDYLSHVIADYQPEWTLNNIKDNKTCTEGQLITVMVMIPVRGDTVSCKHRNCHISTRTSIHRTNWLVGRLTGNSHCVKEPKLQITY